MRDDNTPLMEVFQDATRITPKHGQRKVVFPISVFSKEDYLLALRLERGDTHELAFTSKGKITELLRCTTCLTPEPMQTLTVPDHRLSLADNFGQPVLQTPFYSGETPFLALHQKVSGITLEQFLKIPSESASIWSQKTFDDFMKSAAFIASKGHGLDTGSSGNVLIQNHDSSSPTLVPIDLLFNVRPEHRGTNIGADIAMEYFALSPKGNQSLITALTTAAKNADFGLSIPKDKATFERRFGDKYGENIYNALKDLPKPPIPSTSSLPNSLTELPPFVLPGATLGGLRAHLVSLREADQAAYPDRYTK